VKLRVIRQGMPIASAVAVLGPPSRIDPQTGLHVWYVDAGCHINPQMALETRGNAVTRIVLNSA
jgi:hypothetical protein